MVCEKLLLGQILKKSEVLVLQGIVLRKMSGARAEDTTRLVCTMAPEHSA